MTIREFVKGIIENAFTDAEIIKYCKALDSELLADLLKELWAEYVLCDYVGELSNAKRLKNAYDLICKRFNVDIWEEQQKTDTQSLNDEPQPMELKVLLPFELKADEAVELFQKAIDAKLITYSKEGLKWNDTKQLLAYFATKVSDKFNLTTKLDKDGNKTTDWKTFETLFEQKGLKGAKQNWMRLNTKFEPKGFEKVDALFKSLNTP